MFTVIRRVTVAIALLATTALWAQPERIRSPIDSHNRRPLAGILHAGAMPQNDRGPVEPSFPLPAMTLYLRPSAAQQSALQDLLDRQRDPSSPDYRRWLSPEEFADRFGIAPADLGVLRAWLESQGFTVTQVARSRAWLVFSGTAAEVQRAFGAHIHRYRAAGELYYANADAPSLPAALAGIVTGIDGLDDFPSALRASQLQPQPALNAGGGVHYLAPGDLAVIYDIAGLYQAGIDGTGQKIAIVGQTQPQLADIEAFQARFNLPRRDPETMLVPGFADPGVNSMDLPEADLDLEWAGAVAPQASLIYVYSKSVLSAYSYVVDQNLAPVLSSSYYFGCERKMTPATAAVYRQLAQQANAQGITWVNASGDVGAAGCDSATSMAAQGGKAVTVPADIPEVTGVGGTMFNDSADAAGLYWNPVNGANSVSARSYIPESVWNEAGPGQGLLAAGGGLSTFYPKPSWQTGPGVPGDGARDVPDVSMAAALHDGYYAIVNGSAFVYGGTSASTPVLAGVLGLLNQFLMSSGAQPQPGLGNINPRLYALAQANVGVFHDVVDGGNIVACAAASLDCLQGSFGYSAGPGYDQASGLGSLDVSNFVHQWNPQALQPSIAGAANGASFAQAYAPGMVLSVFGSHLASSTGQAASVPLPTSMGGLTATVNGVPAPLYYVSSTQVNLQVPYETQNGQARLVIANGSSTAAYSFAVTTAAPGIFMDAKSAMLPYSTGARGQTLILFVTGEGQVAPALATGTTPSPDTPLAALPAPEQQVAVTVGGVPAVLRFAGIPSGLVGVTQVNFDVPANAPLGKQPVVVTVGSVASPPAYLTVTE
jgi:uncharacterized protein (TIGR03437 family)